MDHPNLQPLKEIVRRFERLTDQIRSWGIILNSVEHPTNYRFQEESSCGEFSIEMHTHHPYQNGYPCFMIQVDVNDKRDFHVYVTIEIDRDMEISYRFNQVERTMLPEDDGYNDEEIVGINAFLGASGFEPRTNYDLPDGEKAYALIRGLADLFISNRGNKAA